MDLTIKRVLSLFAALQELASIVKVGTQSTRYVVTLMKPLDNLEEVMLLGIVRTSWLPSIEEVSLVLTK
jgi:hypothetical protein